MFLPMNNGSSVRQYGKMVDAIKQGDILMSNLPLEVNATWILAAQAEALGALATVSQEDLITFINGSQQLDVNTFNVLMKLAVSKEWAVASHAIVALSKFKDPATIENIIKTLIAIASNPTSYQEYNVYQTFELLGTIAIPILVQIAVPNSVPSGAIAAMIPLKALGAIKGIESLTVLKNIAQNVSLLSTFRLAALSVVAVRIDLEAIDILIEALNDTILRTSAANTLSGGDTKGSWWSGYITHPERIKNPTITAALQASLDAEKLKAVPDVKYITLLTSILTAI